MVRGYSLRARMGDKSCPYGYTKTFTRVTSAAVNSIEQLH